ncbi:11274_t:CDS:2 [Acaulospora morrowiae]|uniref:11274_t:CDS:1 n=1 Tax=Acaulospora morrowiae TaxID=94023 RepID=A0A9N9F9J5_9GLOM|nr:11274_t:CDS:2 [Acaulospora morrowiae]
MIHDLISSGDGRNIMIVEELLSFVHSPMSTRDIRIEITDSISNEHILIRR